MKIWIKINDSFGFVGIDKDSIDNEMSIDEINTMFGDGFYDRLAETNNTNYLTDQTDSIMITKGWYENDSLFKSNGDVHAYCYEKI